ncbi:hypothetical protein LT330_008662 [Penicillium expansum]|nr:hypothetical protein LT330_008662 [Penicillium expansum]
MSNIKYQDLPPINPPDPQMRPLDRLNGNSPGNMNHLLRVLHLKQKPSNNTSNRTSQLRTRKCPFLSVSSWTRNHRQRVNLGLYRLAIHCGSANFITRNAIFSLVGSRVFAKLSATLFGLLCSEPKSCPIAIDLLKSLHPSDWP